MTTGTCIHCSADVAWDEARGVYVSFSAGAPDLEFCGGVEGEENRHSVPDETQTHDHTLST